MRRELGIVDAAVSDGRNVRIVQGGFGHFASLAIVRELWSHFSKAAVLPIVTPDYQQCAPKAAVTATNLGLPLWTRRVFAARLILLCLFLRHDFKFCDREDRSLLSGSDQSHCRSVTRRANIQSDSESGNHLSSKSSLMPLDPSLVQFVEALAIADASRDHLAFNPPPPEQEAVDGSRTMQAGASNNDSCRRLRKIFD